MMTLPRMAPGWLPEMSAALSMRSTVKVVVCGTTAAEGCSETVAAPAFRQAASVRVPINAVNWRFFMATPSVGNLPQQADVLDVVVIGQIHVDAVRDALPAGFAEHGALDEAAGLHVGGELRRIRHQVHSAHRSA